MKNFIVALALTVCAQMSSAAQWVSVNPADISSVQITQSANSAGQPLGFYIALKNDIVGEAASYCVRKNFIVITDPELMKQAFSAYLFAAASQKTMQFYLNGTGQCTYNGPVATIFTLHP